MILHPADPLTPISPVDLAGLNEYKLLRYMTKELVGQAATFFTVEGCNECLFTAPCSNHLMVFC